MTVNFMAAHEESEQPVFVFGALRSGTTLMRLMLMNHPGLKNPGEADFLFDYITPDPSHPSGWRADREAIAEDRFFRELKMPLPDHMDGADLVREIVSRVAGRETGRLVLNIHRHAPKMTTLFPQAKIIHLLRDPRDVARSSIGMGWSGNSYYGVQHWIGTELGWDEAPALPEAQVLTVHFETLMADLEAELTRITGFLGLPFEPAMLKYYENSTYGPPDPTIAQKWKSKASAREIARLEALIGPLLEARGYTPAGAPVYPGAPERVWLAIEHKIKRWRYNIRRYGAGLFFGHHAARVLRLRGLAERLGKRQEAIQIRNWK